MTKLKIRIVENLKSIMHKMSINFNFIRNLKVEKIDL